MTGPLRRLLRQRTTKHLTEVDPRPSDGYLGDAETWSPDDEDTPPEVVALMRLDRLLGNGRSLSEVGTGRARGIVLSALRAWHTAQTGKSLPAHDGGGETHWCRCDSWRIPLQLRARPHLCHCTLPPEDASHLPSGGPPFVTGPTLFTTCAAHTADPAADVPGGCLCPPEDQGDQP